MLLNLCYSVSDSNLVSRLSDKYLAYLRLNGVNAREHAVFKELTRVKQYFEKLKNAENHVGKRENLTLDKAAAARIVKAGLVS